MQHIEFVTRREAADLAGVSERTIKRWAVADRITTHRDVLSGRVRYEKSQILEAAGKTP